MNNVQDIFTKNRRLAILRFLAEDQDYSLNTSVLQSALAAIGHGVSRDVVEAGRGLAGRAGSGHNGAAGQSPRDGVADQRARRGCGARRGLSSGR